MKLSVIIPTCNAETWIDRQLSGISLQNPPPDEVLIIDSASTDATRDIALSYPLVRFADIPRESFDHGATRSLAARMSRGDILVFLTQDALLASKQSLDLLTRPLQNPEERVAVCYGRQLPHENASPFAAHLRYFNYPARPEGPRTFADRARYGLHTVFCSNSFAAYRREILAAVGFFPERLLLGEDTFAVAKILEFGYAVQYVPEAMVFHAHNYSLSQEAKRYFDIGAFHESARAVFAPYGSAGGKGLRFVLSELRYLAARGHYRLLPQSLLRSAAKFVAYHLGLRATRLKPGLIKRLSQRPDWWQKEETP